VQKPAKYPNFARAKTITMKVVSKTSALASTLNPYRVSGKRIGLVPTMGALHSGHLSLVKRACQENDIVVVSIFVNPTQFDRAEDLEKYPRTVKADVDLLNSMSGHLIIYTAIADDLYQGRVKATRFSFNGLDEVMEGQHRKGHFDGVGTVVSLLFKAVNPHRAYFGEKDYQQLLIVRKLAQIEQFDIEIIGCPIVREHSGLAMSSRNERLTKAQREKASVIYKTIQEVEERFQGSSLEELTRLAYSRFASEPELELEYFIIANADTLEKTDRIKAGTKYRAFIAAFIGSVRLIDNIALN